MRSSPISLESAGRHPRRPGTRYEIYDQLRTPDGIAETRSVVAITGYAAAKHALTHPHAFRSEVLDIPAGIHPTRPVVFDYTRLLGEVTVTLLKPATNSLQPPDLRTRRAHIIEQLGHELIHPIADVVEVVADTIIGSWKSARHVNAPHGFARPLCKDVMGTLFGLTESERRFVDRHIETFAQRSRTTSPTYRITHLTHALRAQRALRDFVTHELLPRSTPASALLHNAIRNISENDSVDAAVGDFVLMMLAGTRATPSLISHGIRQMLIDPVIAANLRTGALHPVSFREEVLRLETPNQVFFRWSSEDVDLLGRAFPPGTKFAVCLGAANRDPSAFMSPNDAMFNRFDSHGRPVAPFATQAPLSFGRGPHFCPGMALTDLIVDTAWRVLVDAVDFPQAAVKERRERGYVTNGYSSLTMPFIPLPA
jgi:cytochrome P450